MSSRSIVKVAVVLLGLLVLALSACSSKPPPGPAPPNFVFFLVDDLGWRDVGCYGSTFYETPNIDRLAGGGIRFTDAYAACPVCSPTRASILTGKYPARLDLTSWIPDGRVGPLRPPDFRQELPLEEYTIAEALKQAGYATGFVGKWHLGDRPYYPENQGFDLNVAGNQFGYPPTYFYPYKKGDYALDLKGGGEGEYLTDRLTEEALHFLKQTEDKPFFLYFSYYTVHNPQEAKPGLVERFTAKRDSLPPFEGPRYVPEGDRENRQVQDDPVYAGMVHSLDESVGRVLAELEEMGVADRTIVFFMSDNGGLSTSEGSPTSNLPLRAGKGWLYEGGIREPLIVRWPGRAQPGAVSHVPVISTDFYPTMLEMAGLELVPGQHRDGVSLVPVLTEAGGLPDRPLFWHFPHYGNQGGAPGAAVRNGVYKLIEFFEDSRVELYDLSSDLSEQNNLASASPETASRLREMLHDWQQSVNAKMPSENPEFDEKAWQEWHRSQRERSRR